MASGSFVSSTGTNLEIGLEWSSSANAANNSSSVTVKVYLLHYQIYCAALTGSYISAGDSTSYYSAAVSSSASGLQKTYVGEHTFTVPHSADGTKSVALGAGYVFNGTYNGHYIGTLSVSGTAILDKIPRASDFTLPALTLTKAASVTVRPASSSYRHRAVLKVGQATYSTSVLSGSPISVTPPASLADGAPSSVKPSGTFTLETYSGQTKLGEVTKNCSFTVPNTDEFKAEFTVTLTPHNESSLLDSEGILAAKLSSLTLAVSGVSCRHGAGVSSVKICFGSAKSDTYTYDTGALTAGTHVWTASVTDSRGKVSSKSGSVTVLPYFEPFAENVEVFRCDEHGEPSDTGAYLSVTASARCAELDGLGAATLSAVLKSRAGTTLGTWALTDGVRRIIDCSLSPVASYTLTVVTTDPAGGVGRHNATVPTSKVDLHLKDGRLRIGGYAERAGVECDWDARFNGSISVGEDALADFVCERGEDGIWTWRKFASGDSECFGTAGGASYTFSQSGAVFRAAVPSVQYPDSLFIAPPAVSATPSAGAAFAAVPAVAGTSSASPQIYLFSGASGSAAASVFLYCRGKWRSGE